jgi:adenosylcobinamide-GDP ribazoletransferase
MCLTSFSRVPCPWRGWDEEAKPLVPSYLPAVGILLGALWCAFAYVLRLLHAPSSLSAALIVLFPYLSAGLIHLDGFMDASDALLSWRDREERIRILKDSHVGSFAVASVALLFLISFGAALSFVERGAFAPYLLCVPCATRCCAAFAVTRLKPLTQSQYHARQDKNASPFLFFALCLAAAFVTAGWRGLVVPIVATAAYSLALWRAVKSLGGVSGDLSGYALTIGEAAALVAAACL